MIAGVDSTELGATDAGEGRDERTAARERTVAVAPASSAASRGGCPRCGVLVGAWTRVHFAKATDATPCPGSWGR